MSKKPETLTCHQVWKRYYNYSEKRTRLHYKWKHFVGELRDIEYRIALVKEAISKEYKNLPADGRRTPRFIFLGQELIRLTDLRKETHTIIAFYKKECQIATTQSNRYKMANRCLKSIAIGQLLRKNTKGLSIKESNATAKFIDEFKCEVLTNKDGSLDVMVECTGTDKASKFKF